VLILYLGSTVSYIICPWIIWARIASAFVFEISLIWEQMIKNTYYRFCPNFLSILFSCHESRGHDEHSSFCSLSFFFTDPCESGSRFAILRGDGDHVGGEGEEEGMKRGEGKESGGGKVGDIVLLLRSLPDYNVTVNSTSLSDDCRNTKLVV
jgi:hypothetical protein